MMDTGAGSAHFDVLPPPPFHTSRLCVKNIPKYVNEARLRQHFAEQGDVTDVKIVKTKYALSSGGVALPCSVQQHAAK